MCASVPSVRFDQGKPFFDMVLTYLPATVGLGVVLGDYRKMLDNSQGAVFLGRYVPNNHWVVDFQQLRDNIEANIVTPETTIPALTCMLVNTAYESVRDRNDKSPEFDVFGRERAELSG